MFIYLGNVNVCVVAEAYLVVGGIVGVLHLHSPIEGKQVTLLHLTI